MEKKFKQPDLFLVMNEEEMDEALSYAEEMIGNQDKNIEMYLNFSTYDDNTGQYKITINNIDAKEYILDENNNYKFEFPMIPYYCLIFFENEGVEDCIALAIPISVWPKAYDIDYIKSFFTKHNFKIQDYVNRFLLSEELETTIIPEFEQAQSKQIDSPWTIRDKDTLKEALLPGGDASAIDSIDDIDGIILIKNSNITLDFNATVITSPRLDTAKIDYSTFNFSNSLIIYKTDGKKTPIYIGDDVSYEEITNILDENNLSKFTTSKDLNNFVENMDDIVKEVMPLARFTGNTPKSK